jgi:hypothetical protein
VDFGGTNYNVNQLQADINAYQNLLYAHRNKTETFGVPAGANFLLTVSQQSWHGRKRKQRGNKSRFFRTELN